MNACRVFSVQNSFELDLFGFAHDADFRSKLIERLDIAHAAEHLRGDLRNYRFKIVIHAIADVCFIKCCGIICEYVACHWEAQPYSPIYGITLDMLRRTRYEQTNDKVGGFGFFLRQGHAVIYLRSVIMHGGDIQPALKHAAIVFLLHSADLFCVQKRNGTFGDTFEVGKQFIFKGKPTKLGKIAYIMSDGNGVQAVGAVDEIFDADGVFVCVVEYLLGHGVKHG